MTLAVTPAGVVRTRDDEGVVAGARLGRYIAIGVLGVGGMGTVIRAYDPKLCREVAVKRLHADALDAAAEARLLREAQAMAQLSHPNVIAVYDADTSDGTVMLAMEYVRGVTLKRWLKDAPRSATEVLAVFARAGAGLAAAHRRGLVHRDFKPGNVMVADDDESNGRERAVKVGDFGLAKSVEARSKNDDVQSSRSGRQVFDSAESLGIPLTRDDVVLGTPRYMAPEQHAGKVATAASDQFSFCVAVWEALCGESPYSRSSAKQAGPPSWPRMRGVPASVGAALRRGLSAAPNDRFPDMETLLQALELESARSRRRQWLAVSAGALMAGGLSTAYALQTDPGNRCETVTDRALGLWDATRRAELQAAFVGTEMPFAEDSWRQVAGDVDHYVEGWLNQHREVCHASVDGFEPQRELAQRTRCLDRVEGELRAILRVMEEPDPVIVERAGRLIAGLPSLTQCEDLAILESEFPPPNDPELAPRVNAARDGLREARLARELGRLERPKR